MHTFGSLLLLLAFVLMCLGTDGGFKGGIFVGLLAFYLVSL